MAGEQLTTSNAPGWNAWGQKFLATRDAFTKSFAELLQKQNFIYTVHPELRAEYDRKVAEGFKKRTDLENLNEIYKQVSAGLQTVGTFAAGAFKASPFGLAYDAGFNLVSWAKNALGFHGLTQDDDGNMGLAPIVIAIGLGVATAMVAAIAFFVTDNNKYVARLTALQQLQGAGLSPEQAVQVVDNQKRLETQQAILGNPFLLIAIAGAAVLIIPKLLEGGKRG